MLKKTITYKDFNDNEISEDFYFHLSQAEIVELEVSHQGGLSVAIQRIMDAEDLDSLMAEFKKIILMAYGKRSADGRRFIKTQELRDEFTSSNAYSALFMELITNTDAAIEFTTGIVPAEMAEQAAKLQGIDPKATPIIAVVTEPEIVTKKDIAEMTPEQLAKLGERITKGEVKLEEDPVQGA